MLENDIFWPLNGPLLTLKTVHQCQQQLQDVQKQVLTQTQQWEQTRVGYDQRVELYV